MNSINGNITRITSEGSFQLIEVSKGTSTLYAIIIKSEHNSYQKNDEVTLHIKETEIALATKRLPEISLQNQIEGTISSLEKDHLLSRIVLDTVHGPLAAIITTASVERLGLSEGSPAVAMVKTNEVMVSKA